MKIVSVTDEEITVELSGDLDAVSAPTARQTFFDAWQAGPGNIILNCENLEFVDSAGVGAIVYLYKSLAQRNSRSLLIRNVRGQPAQLFKIVGLASFIDISD